MTRQNLEEAVACLNANGTKNPLTEASNNKGQLIDRDLYLGIYAVNGFVGAHGTNVKLIGREIQAKSVYLEKADDPVIW